MKITSGGLFRKIRNIWGSLLSCDIFIVGRRWKLYTPSVTPTTAGALRIIFIQRLAEGPLAEAHALLVLSLLKK